MGYGWGYHAHARKRWRTRVIACEDANDQQTTEQQMLKAKDIIRHLIPRAKSEYQKMKMEVWGMRKRCASEYSSYPHHNLANGDLEVLEITDIFRKS